MQRRDFLKLAAGVTAWGAVGACAAESSIDDEGESKVRSSRLPRWRGFNLLEKFRAEKNVPFRESDFEMMEEWGFDFARLPLSYRAWTDPNDWLALREDVLKEIDQAVELGKKHKVHVNINFHRAPRYCVNPPKEPLDLWSAEKAL